MKEVYSIYMKGTHEWVATVGTLVRAMTMVHDLNAEAGLDYYARKEYYVDGKLVCWDTKL